jgi:hypothetical protein
VRHCSGIIRGIAAMTKTNMLQAFKYLAASNPEAAKLAEFDFGVPVDQITEPMIYAQLSTEAVDSLRELAASMDYRKVAASRSIKRKGGRP